MVNQPELKPNYLPQLVHGKEPTISEQTIEILAFVLSGIDPSVRVRHIEESFKTRSEPPRQSWYTSLLGRFSLSKDTSGSTFHIDQDIRREVGRYVEDMIKIGRLLRANVRRG